MTGQLDVVIVAHPKDFEALDLTIDCAIANIEGVRRVFVVSFERYRSDSPLVRFVPEPRRPGFPTLDVVARRWESENPSLAGRAGWVYQQFLTLGAPAYTEGLSQTYLCIDADTMFLRPVRFLFEGIRLVYTHSPYRHDPADEAYRRLTGEAPARQSFTAHHMLYDTELLGALFAHIEGLHGKPWFEAYLDSIDFGQASPISEQDVYANWVVAHHPVLARHRQLSWADIPYLPSTRQRRRLARRFDFVSAHAYMRQSAIRRMPSSLTAAVGWAMRRLPGARRLLPASRPTRPG